MALFTINNILIRGVSAAVPNNKVETKALSVFNQEEVDTFINTVGIKSRYMADSNTCASDLCYHAAEKLLLDLKWKKEDIGVLIFESVTADYRTPPTSTILQERLGLSFNCMTMDIPMGCCGFLYGLLVAGKMLSSQTSKAIILVGDTVTRMSSPYDKSRVPLFGDCGTAIALEYNEDAEDIIMELYSHGKGAEALITPHSGFRNPVTEESFKYEDFGNGVVRSPMHSLINGMDVFAFAISKPPKSIVEFMDKYHLDKDKDIDYYLIHQANKMIVDRVIKKLKIDSNKVPMNIDRFANCGGASIPLLMVTEMSDVLGTQSLNLFVSAFGLGLTWGNAIIKTQPMLVSELLFV